MPKYTYQAGAHWPRQLLDLSNYRDADNTVGPIIAQIKAYQEAGDYDAAQQIINQHASTLKKYCFDSAAINKYIEELRNLEIYSKSKKQQIFYEPTEDSFANYAVLQDVWIGNKSDASESYVQSDAREFQVLEGVNFVGSDGKIHVGTMPNYEAVEAYLDPGETYVIPAGYHNGSGTVSTTTVVPSGETYYLGEFDHNSPSGGVIGPIDVSGASAVTLKINVPSIMTGEIETVKGTNTINLPREVKQFFYVTGKFEEARASSSIAYSIWAKLADGSWKKFNNTSKASKITDISGSTVTLNWDYITHLSYYGY